MSKTNSMKLFWNEKAKENAAFYIATWRGYDNPSLDDFFLTAEDAHKYLTKARFDYESSCRMLEIGCGVGRMTSGFAQHFTEVHAIDVSSEMIEQATVNLAKFENVFLYETDGSSLDPFADSYFDFCFSFIVFQHLPSRELISKYIREVGRALVPGGTFYFQVNGLPDPEWNTPHNILKVKKVYRNYLRAPVLTAWRRFNGLPYGFEAPEWVGTSMTRKQVEEACMVSGLEITHIEGEDTQYMWITATKPSAML